RRTSMSREPLDLSKQHFGRLEVLARAGKDKAGNPLWLSRCQCGTLVRRTTSNTRKAVSCGCYQNPRQSSKMSPEEAKPFLEAIPAPKSIKESQNVGEASRVQDETGLLHLEVR